MPVDIKLIPPTHYPGPPEETVEIAGAAVSALTRCHSASLDPELVLLQAAVRRSTTLRFSSDGARPGSSDPVIFLPENACVQIMVPVGRSLWYNNTGSNNDGSFSAYRVDGGRGWRRNAAPVYTADTQALTLSGSASTRNVATVRATDADSDEIYWSQVGDWDPHFTLTGTTAGRRAIRYTRLNNADIADGDYELTVGITDRQIDHGVVTRTYTVTVS